MRQNNNTNKANKFLIRFVHILPSIELFYFFFSFFFLVVLYFNFFLFRFYLVVLHFLNFHRCSQRETCAHGIQLVHSKTTKKNFFVYAFSNAWIFAVLVSSIENRERKRRNQNWMKWKQKTKKIWKKRWRREKREKVGNKITKERKSFKVKCHDEQCRIACKILVSIFPCADHICSQNDMNVNKWQTATITNEVRMISLVPFGSLQFYVALAAAAVAIQFSTGQNWRSCIERMNNRKLYETKKKKIERETFSRELRKFVRMK